MNLNELIVKGGVLIYPMLFMSVVALYIIFDRIIIFSTIGRISNSWYKNILGALRSKKIEYVTEEVKKHNNVLSNTFSKIFEDLEQGASIEYVDNLSEQYALYEISKLEKKLSLLSIISSSATMIGFLGTVLGLIESFNTISSTTEPVTPHLIANGIYEAMITTAVGLVIGIISDCFYRYFVSSLNKKITKMEGYTNEIISTIRENQISFIRK